MIYYGIIREMVHSVLPNYREYPLYNYDKTLFFKNMAIYLTNDAAHNLHHAGDVCDNGIKFYNHIKDKELYTPLVVNIACIYHDVGLNPHREVHHIESGKIFLSDSEKTTLQYILTPKQVKDIHTAIVQHRASTHAIYDTELSEYLRCCDGLHPPISTLRRAYYYSTHHNPDLSIYDHLHIAKNHIHIKYTGDIAYANKLPMGWANKILVEYLKELTEMLTFGDDLLLTLITDKNNITQ